ncbi:class I SAM-dependent DNA methyltransferase [Rhodococcus sp. SORGH_AS_0301]|uniref:HsdM family class I SAM-dependent methyltransferase n=1 Tax=Rhodococcus sp. SORGH_AS_0301 TaxID=3041780 RepID=UPI002782BDCA|nr:N-6 DNA methylase [Rhodococcus sp. SORGH_AS_0301]MDQ1179216.1 hypothetical protein [Rhodococcus sp. SORGH_AS_0301]
MAISILYNQLLVNPAVRHTWGYSEWRTDITVQRGALDRKKAIKPGAISRATGCDLRNEDVPLYVFSIERYLELKAILAIRGILGSENIANAPKYLKQASKRADATSAALTELAPSLISSEIEWVSSIISESSGSPIRDHFQSIYHELLPREIRHAVGQFYTPQWLARHTLRQLGYKSEDPDSLLRTICDPTCGSGVFLVAAAEEVRQAVQNRSVTIEAGLEQVAHRLTGADIGALPCLLATTNLILALSAISIDNNIELISEALHSIKCADALDAQSGDQVNADVVVSNPPWTNWEYMPTEFRQKHINLWPRLGIYKKSVKNAGFSKEDVSALFVAHAIAHRLKPGGDFAFILPESLVKSATNHAEFRRFEVGILPRPYAITLMEDFVATKPFDGVSNRTIGIYGRSDSLTRYPIAVHKWGKLPGDKQPVTGNAGLSFDPVIQWATLSKSDDVTSSWSTSSASASALHRAVDGPNMYRGRTGLFTGGANGVFHIRRLTTRGEYITVENVTERAKRKVDTVRAVIEPTYIYPFLRGRDVSQWKYDSEISTLLPHTKETKMQPVDEETMREEAPLTYDYLSQFKSTLADRRGFSKWELPYLQTAFYACQRVGEYTFSDWKVVWRYISARFTTAVIGPSKEDLKPHIPNEKLMLIACGSKDEAFFVGGILASAPVISHVHSRMVSTQIPPSIVQNIAIPQFNPRNSIHMEIARFCELGHQHTGKGLGPEARLCADEIDMLVCRLWGLSEIAVAAERRSIGY